MYLRLGLFSAVLLFARVQTEAHFAGFFLAKLLGKPVLVDDLHSLDPELYRNLVSLKSFEGNFDELGLNFAVRCTVLWKCNWFMDCF